MANINSQKKRIRQDKKRNLRNKSIKTELKTVLKSVEDSSVENKTNALKTLDIAYSKGIITKNFRDLIFFILTLYEKKINSPSFVLFELWKGLTALIQSTLYH